MTKYILNQNSYVCSCANSLKFISNIYHQYIPIDIYEKDFEYNEALEEAENEAEEKQVQRTNSVAIQDYVYNIYNAMYGKTLSSNINIEDNKEIIEETIEELKKHLEIPEIHNLLTSIFRKKDRDGIPVIDALDYMKWCVKRLEYGDWVYENHSPIGFLATKILGVPEDDTKEARRESRRKAKGVMDISLNHVLEDENGHKYNGEDIYLPPYEDRTIADVDDEVLNIKYLNPDEKRMFDLRVQGYTIRELQNIFHISKSQVETRLKNIYRKLKNPVIEQICSIDKECKHCHEVKPLNEFVKDKRRNDGHGSICKRCDRERKNNYTGNIGKIAV